MRCILGEPDTFADQQIQLTRAMGAYRASTLVDFERGQPLEFESLFLEPLRQATQAGVKMPRLAALCLMLNDITLKAGLRRSSHPIIMNALATTP